MACMYAQSEGGAGLELWRATGSIKHTVLMHKDRLIRFGYEIIEQICQAMHVKITILEESPFKQRSKPYVAILIEIRILQCVLRDAKPLKQAKMHRFVHLFLQLFNPKLFQLAGCFCGDGICQAIQVQRARDKLDRIVAPLHAV